MLQISAIGDPHSKPEVAFYVREMSRYMYLT